MIKNVCVYASSSELLDNSYMEAATDLGKALAQRGWGLVYGAGGYGLMGAAARGAREAGGSVIGVIPEKMDVDGVVYEGCTELFVTRTMRERKALMEDKSDAFIALPGGFGTFEEVLEIIALRLLMYHTKPVVILNINGYYDALVRQFDVAVEQKFASPKALEMYGVFSGIEQALAYIENYEPEVYIKNELFK
jgi:uncharacterized protein (TIGR00730 family)